ncbi:hypothetical protein LPC08_06190 [Roseomonas sp. OT10]|uniref:hypothetical protein n=1 Tax=Roseomonas cutis TaxID=2897332 RepID=UPI001E32BB10|nr:hypothetical protein [Roseomonas sp. OT10]UFN50212.1 hypothetical protein LPC08_06190 [Roseomonas sp. OT10]
MRVAVLGTAGSGKTAFARRLAARAGVPRIELDAINGQPGRRDLDTGDPEEFRRRVAVARERWVSDGHYGRVRDIVPARATHLAWLDYPRRLTMRRVLWRSVRRAASGEELWPGTGNREDARRWLDRGHPIRWAWAPPGERRRTYAALLEEPALAGPERHRVTRPAEAERLLLRPGDAAGGTASAASPA